MMLINYSIICRLLPHIVFALISCSFGYSQSPPGFKRPPIHEHDFAWGGVDSRSYVYWPVTPPDVKPLQLVKAGKREEAFLYCFAKMKETKGDLKFFYSIQAASMGFSIWQSPKVVDALMPEYNLAVLKAKKHRLSVAKSDPNIALSIAFAIRLSGYAGADMPNHRNSQAWQNTWKANSVALQTALYSYQEATYSRTEHRAVSAVLTSLNSFQSTTAFDQWKSVLKTNPRSPQLNLAMSFFASITTIENVPGKGDVYHRSAPEGTAQQYSERALELDPDNVRAMYSVAIFVESTNPSRARALLTRYLDIGSGPAPERIKARIVLDDLNRRNPK